MAGCCNEPKVPHVLCVLSKEPYILASHTHVTTYMGGMYNGGCACNQPANLHISPWIICKTSVSAAMDSQYWAIPPNCNPRWSLLSSPPMLVTSFVTPGTTAQRFIPATSDLTVNPLSRRSHWDQLTAYTVFWNTGDLKKSWFMRSCMRQTSRSGMLCTT